MKNMRITQKDFVNTEEMGFVLENKDPDFCVRVLGAKLGKLAFFDEPKTTTLNVKVLAHGNIDEVRSLFEEVDLVKEDFFFSVSVPYVDKYDLLRKVRKIYEEKTC